MFCFVLIYCTYIEGVCQGKREKGKCDLRCELVVREIADDVWDGMGWGNMMG